MHIGKHLKTARERAGKTALEVAMYLGCREGKIYKWEAGTEDIRVRDYRRVAIFLEMTNEQVHDMILEDISGD